MAKKQTGGARWTVFPGKLRLQARARVTGYLTLDGKRAFERARERLAVLARRPESEISDADTIEFLARGEAATRKQLKTLGT